jgi:hypothetical protein
MEVLFEQEHLSIGRTGRVGLYLHPNRTCDGQVDVGEPAVIPLVGGFAKTIMRPIGEFGIAFRRVDASPGRLFPLHLDVAV